MTTKSTTVKESKPDTKPFVQPARVKVVNESRLVLAQDVEGFTSNFRREAARSVGRIMADPRKLAVFKELLATFGQYAEDRYEHSLVERDTAIANKAARLQEAQAKALRDADNVIKSKRAHMQQLTDELEVHDAKMQKLR